MDTPGGIQKGIIPHETPGGIQKMNVIDEPGLYRLILRSDKPAAESFMEWITSDVLPAIRKTCEVLENIEYTGNIDGIVYSCNGVATTTSVNIAAVFCKDHKNIIRTIENKINSGNKTLAQFCADY